MAVVAIAGATAVREIVRSDDDSGAAETNIERTASTRVKGETEPIEFAGGDDVPATWRIQFRIAAPGSVITEEVLVRAPFDSHEDVRAGGTFTERREAALGIAVSQPVGGEPVGLAPVPEPAGFRPGPIVADAVEYGLLVAREQREVAGRRCQVYRTSAELSGTTFVVPDSDTDFVDVCIDADGLLLESLESFQGKLIRQRVALRVALDVDVTDDDVNQIPHEQTLPAIQGGGSVREMEPTSKPVGKFLELDAPPAGYTLLGRYEVVPPQPNIAQPETRGEVVAAVSDVFVDGPSTIIVERGARLDKGAPWEPDDRLPDIDLGPLLGTGEFIAGITGGEVRARLVGGRFVRVYGTAPLDQLVTIAKGLRETEGGTGPVYIEG